ncbi:M50 family metallopeptidase [Anaerolineales bacterium HSG24]|nr:M50 family metallopeptidase [Anaerolineales bacterium HSG24]
MKNLLLASKNSKLSTQQTLALIGFAGLTTVLMMVVPVLSWFNYPFRLLLTMVHELSHGLAAVLTGGNFVRFIIEPNGAGLAYTAGGLRFIVIPAGYLGTALFGAVLILLGRNHRWSRWAIGLIGGAFFLFGLIYGLPGIFTGLVTGEAGGAILATISGWLFGLIFLIIALKANPSGIIFWIHFLAIQAALTTFSDLWGLIGLTTQGGQIPANDALSMSNLTYIPAIIWAMLWVLIAIVLIGGAIWLTWVQPVMRGYQKSNLMDNWPTK